MDLGFVKEEYLDLAAAAQALWPRIAWLSGGGITQNFKSTTIYRGLTNQEKYAKMKPVTIL